MQLFRNFLSLGHLHEVLWGCSGRDILLNKPNMKHKFFQENFWPFSTMRWSRRKIATILLGTLIFSLLNALRPLHMAQAATEGSVVINEVAWAGSQDSSSDEWIELYNPTSQDIDLSNWYFMKGTIATKYKILGGIIPSHGYFLIEDHESAVLNIPSDSIISLSLSNSGYSLKLFDDADQAIDIINSNGSAWPAGSATTKASMERIDPLSSGDVNTNWGNSTGSGDTSSGNSAIIGTPKRGNVATSSGTTPTQTSTISLNLNATSYQPGDTLTATIHVSSVTNLFAYGFDLTYDPNLLQYQSATELNFLNDNVSTASSFQAGLENGQPGKLLVAGARTASPKSGISGSGDLLTIQWKVMGTSANPGTLDFQSNSFAADTTHDLAVEFQDKTYSIVAPVTIAPVTNLQISQGTERYSLTLTWTAVANATGYRVLRMDAHGIWKPLQDITGLTFTDKDGAVNGGYLIPDQNYTYQVIALNNTVLSAPTQSTAKETRGLKGDNNRSDRVDGRDLEKLAQHFGESDTDSTFHKLADTTYDGLINGSDLIDLGANFALTYS